MREGIGEGVDGTMFRASSRDGTVSIDMGLELFSVISTELN